METNTGRSFADVTLALDRVKDITVKSFKFDGKHLGKLPAITIRDAIISRMASPKDRVRIQLVYPEDGPDDRWRVACEMSLGGGLQWEDRTYRILGGSDSIKNGAVWLAKDDLRDRLHL